MKRRGGFRSTSQVVLDGMTAPFIVALVILGVAACAFQLPERFGWPVFFVVALSANAAEAIWNWLIQKKNANHR